MPYIMVIFFILTFNIYSQTLHTEKPVEVSINDLSVSVNNTLKLKTSDTIKTDTNTVIMIEYANRYYYISPNTEVSISSSSVVLKTGMMFERRSKYNSLDTFLNKQNTIKLYSDLYPLRASKITTFYLLSMEKVVIKRSRLNNSGWPVVKFNLAGSSEGYNVYRSIFGIHLGSRQANIPFDLTFDMDDGSVVSMRSIFECVLTPAPPPKPKEVLQVNRQMTTILSDPAKSAAERALLQNEVYNQFIPKLYCEDSVHIMPSFGRYSSYYGAFRGYTSDYARFHEGFDMANDTGTPIRASNAGLVRISRELFTRGNCVVIDHGEGVFTSYFHMSKLIAKEGTMVNKGDIIGEIGTTGMSTGPHLHWELRAGNVTVDSLSILDKTFIFNKKTMVQII